ncbi:hypothetical protein [Costertonia aggregata]|uniref:Uncharacterized protein n=1 Tax=Costertonia aggregata TaxID=343403 RepID=A0A7H9ARG1_9FLAO|nr:hypothetical protein [Costertonia aggregata]QLG46043.1 hypothetical protein HYG79_12040 [Costertonia aggregata]
MANAPTNDQRNIDRIKETFNVEGVEIISDGIYKSGNQYYSTKGGLNNNYKPREIEKPSQGLGDDIEKVLKSTGIKKVVELFTPEGKDCGCEKRKQLLNKLLPKNKPNCFTKEQFEDWQNVSESIKLTNAITTENQTKIIMYLRSILNMSVSADSCKSCNVSTWKKYIDMLDKVAQTYQQ